MKKIIISVAAAAMALSTSAMAIDNVKANGSAKLIYQGADSSAVSATNPNPVTGATSDSLFDRTNASAQVGVTMGLSADLSSNLKGAVEVSAVSTLGLENNLVAGTMATNSNVNAGYNAGNTPEAATDDQFWISQAYLTYNMGKTTAKVGIQELNTPLVFTEKWNVVKNTFQAIVLVNNDIENVTLVGAYVGKGNSIASAANGGGLTGGAGQVVNYDGKFEAFHGGAYAAGAVTKIAGINAQAWYYDIDDVLNLGTVSGDAYWLEADTKVGGIFLGAQYAGTKTEGNNPAAAADNQSIDAYAVKAAMNVAGADVFAAYSSVGDDATNGVALGFANFGTGDKTKLYTGTGSILADGAAVATEDTKAWKIGAKGKVYGYGLGLEYTDADFGANANASTAGVSANGDMNVIQAFVAKKVGPIALKGMYTEREVNTVAGTTTDTDLFRLIASAKF